MLTLEPRWLVLSDGARPTEDIYFLEAAAQGIREQGGSVDRIVVSRAFGAARFSGPGILSRYGGAKLLICRSLPLSWLRWLERHREDFGYIGYLIDDDIPAAATDPELPGHYRQRMAGIASLQPRLLALCNEVVASSDALAARMMSAHRRVEVLTPPLIGALPGHEHFNSPPSTAQPWQIGFHGTRAHLPDLQYIAPALTTLQQQRADTELEIMLGENTPQTLSRLPGTSTPDALPWQAFRQYQASRRLHIGLAPLLETPFNRGKSYIKFLDMGAMGAVGVYSNRYPYTDVVRHGENGLLVDDSPRQWNLAIEQLLNYPEDSARMACQAAQDAQRVGNVQRAVNFWLSR